MMKWFKRSTKKRDNSFTKDIDVSYIPRRRSSAPLESSLVDNLPHPVLERIFSFVCPHAQDESYESCELSALEDTCMLCDLRDLAHCAQVSWRWRDLAGNVLYHSIRIDQVHYCDREDILAERRKRKSFLSRNAEPEDTAQARLRLLCRTLRDDKEKGYGAKVKFLKIPYMTRETCKADLARTVQVLPNLLYVDLPEGFFSDDQSCHALKKEVQASCRDIRKMSYFSGAERTLEQLASGMVWRNLEVLELSKLTMDPAILRQALGSLPWLRALKITDMKLFNDEIFQFSEYLPPFPALRELIFENTPNLTADGLATYLFRNDVQATVTTLSLTSTGVHPAGLHRFLTLAPNLRNFSIIESVSTSFPATNIPLLQSSTITTFHYEITSASSANSYTTTTASYYAYLTSSLMSGGFPNLKQLYVRDPDFPESLLDLSPPRPAFASDPDNYLPSPNMHLAHTHTRSQSNPFLASPASPSSSSSLSPHNTNLNRFSSNNPFINPSIPYSQTQSQLTSPTQQSSSPFNSPTQQIQSPIGLPRTLQVYSKGLDEMEWNFSRVQPPVNGQTRGQATQMRPVSSYGLTGDMGAWKGAGGGARRSVVVGNGFGGFLAVPVEEDGGVGGKGSGRPSTSDGARRVVRRSGSKGDLWR